MCLYVFFQTISKVKIEVTRVLATLGGGKQAHPALLISTLHSSLFWV